ncbi:MAG: phosphoglucosamine mutase [Desulfamplus sp.]|nr:phosphoglucosamine mutase [Desulfamplus sp.]
MKKLFGTDGIRGIANKYPMTPTMAMNTGVAIAKYVKKEGCNYIVIGRDTRLSGQMLESALAAGITSQGVNVLTAGVVPTPAVAFLLSSFNQSEMRFGEPEEADIKDTIGAGVVISASHNPWQDNGIKVFKRGGWKLSDDEEQMIESTILSLLSECSDDKNGESDTGRIYTISDAEKMYCEFLKKGFTPKRYHKSVFSSQYQESCQDNKPLKIVVDCSNGAASAVAPILFDGSFFLSTQSERCNTLEGQPNWAMLFNASFIFNQPDGKNINEQCGSQHTETLSLKVVESGADVGLAFDGDADRLIAIDETGAVITGDRILAICAAHAKANGTLDNNCVVSTVMSNIGLARTLQSLGVEHLITGVGDREVLQKMLESGSVMGGEDSGHMIFSQYHTTGDGLLTSLRLIEVMIDTGKPLSELASIMKVYPQILMNVEVDVSRPDFMAVKSIADEIRAVEAELGADGRVLVRYSGTQPLLRVMVEGPDHDKTRECCERICNKIRDYKL